MSNKTIYQIILIVTFGCICTAGNAQLNIKAGFTSLYTPAKQHNSIVAEFNNQEEARLQNPMSNLHFLNGLQVGARYRFSGVALDVTWENVLRKRKGNGEDPSTLTLFEKEYFYNINAISVNIESIINENLIFSLGLGRRNTRIRRYINGSQVRIDLFDEKQYQYFVQAKLMFVLSPNASTPIALIPFYSYPLKHIGLGEFQQDLGLATVSDTKERFTSFGFSIVYYYGNK